MSKKKKKLTDELLDLKMNEGEKSDIDLQDLDLAANDIPDAKTAPVQASGDQTIRLVHTNTEALPPTPKAESAPDVQFNSKQEPVEEAKVSYGLPATQQVPRSPDLAAPMADAPLQSSEHLRIAQRKINELEEEVAKLRRESEDLGSAAETYKKLNDEYYAEIEALKSKAHDHKQTSSQEIKLLKNITQNKDKQIVELKQQIDEYKSRIDNNFQRVRKREKDLEHRLEIAKIEEVAVVKSKDQLILDLKRRIDEITNESDNFRRKSQENYKELQKKQQVVRGVIRALRLALTKLEGDDDSEIVDDQTEGGVAGD